MRAGLGTLSDVGVGPMVVMAVSGVGPSLVRGGTRTVKNAKGSVFYLVARNQSQYLMMEALELYKIVFNKSIT